MRATPVGHDQAGKTPLPFQDVVEQIVILAAILAAEFIVGAHDRPYATLLHSGSERRQVDLPQGALVHLDVDRTAPGFLVVGREMFHA